MRIEGDIKVWTDGEKACARLFADGPEGPIIIQASAPLAPIRRKVARMFARRGVTVSGNDTAFKATVQQLGRRKALRRLQGMAPGAFRKGGLGPYLARQELRRRRRKREALDRAGRPVGAKPVGPLRGGRKRRRRWARLPIARPAPLRVPLAAALRPALPAAAAPALAPASSAVHRPGASSPGAGTTASDEMDPTAAAESEPEGQADEESPVDPDREEGDDETLDDEATADDEPEEEVSGDDDPQEVSLRRQLAVERLRAALRLLSAAARDPGARRRVRYIVTLAGEGDPKARKALAALTTAQKVKKRAVARKAKARALAPVTARPALPAAPPLPIATRPATPAPPDSMRWWDILAAWRRGIG